MKEKAITKGANREPSTRTVGFSQFNLADRQKVDKVRQLLIELAMKTRQLTKKDIDNWRQSWQIAINQENPKRNRLIDVYVDVMVDAHLSGAIRNRKTQTIAKSFSVVNSKTREVSEDLTAALEAPWFKQFVNHALDSIFWGYSLVQFGDPITDPVPGFESVQLVPREHVVPEFSRVVKEPSDEWKKGTEYTTPPISDWCIGIGEPTNLGLLLNASPHAISKKNMAAYWDQFGEVFGMPIRIGTTTSRDQKERTKIETMLEEMGSAAWGLFQEGTDIKIVESTRGDAYNVYDKRIERCNSEMSKLVTGETMTMDNGASKSQGEVHERIFRDLCDQDADFVKDVVNFKLFPFLRKHGFNFDGFSFQWNESMEFTPEQQIQIDQMLINNYEIDPKYFTDKYKVPITGAKGSPTPTNFFS